MTQTEMTSQTKLDEITKWILDHVHIQPGDTVDINAEVKPEDETGFLSLKLVINGTPEFLPLGYEDENLFQKDIPMLKSYIHERLTQHN